MFRSIGPRASAIAVCFIVTLCCPIVARAQTVDPGFNPGANQIIVTLAVQGDGKILVGGGFTGLGGGTGTTTRNRIGRLNADGTVDATFNPGANSIVQAIAVQPDGKILIGGNFTAVGGGTGLTSLRSHIARLNADGSVDAAFNPGVNGNVYALIVQPDGKILVGGEFSIVGGQTRNRLARLASADGTPDAFNPGASKVPAGASAIVYTMALQADGKIVVGGYFNGLGGGTGDTVRNFIGRVNADGTLDPDYNPGASSISGVNALALQADGKVVVGGSFTGLGLGTGTTLRSNIGRINSDGLVDLTFNPGAEAQVLTLGVQADGKIIAGGYFKWMGDAGGPNRSVRNYVGRVSEDGLVDATFNPGADNILDALAIQPDGAILASGSFSHVGDGTGLTNVRSSIARFPTTNAAIQSLTLTGGGTAPSVMTWSRSGAGPEVSRVTFEFSFDGSFYSLLGSGTRLVGGWRLIGVNLPNTRKVWIRARGSYGTGFQNGSGSIVESILLHNPVTTRDGDFDGDGKADVAVFRPSTGTWYVLQSGTSTPAFFNWGVVGDIPVPGDYDGDGKIDVAVFRPSNGIWYVMQSSTSALAFYQWGLTGDLPVPGDYDADGKTDVAVFRPTTGTWYVRDLVTNTASFYQWGLNGDMPVAADYDGDGRTDVAVFRPSTAIWYILNSSSGYSTQSFLQWGITGDVPVPGDYDGDGKADSAVYRPSTGIWYVRNLATNTASFYQWGIPGDIQVPGDYDGDGRTDVAVFRPSNGTWYIWYVGPGTFAFFQWGASGDTPILKRP